MEKVALNTDNASKGFMAHFSPQGDLPGLCLIRRNSNQVSGVWIYDELYKEGRKYWNEIKCMANEARG